MNTKHTAGPWMDSGHEIKADGKGPLFVVTMARTGNERCVICRIENSVSGRPLDDEDFANARLIAAAPELLEALKHILKYDDDGLGLIGATLARAAVAKADGRAP